MYDTYNTIIPNIDEHKINNQLIDVRKVTALYHVSVNFDILYKYSMWLVNIQEYFPEVPWIAWMCYIARRQRRMVI